MEQIKKVEGFVSKHSQGYGVFYTKPTEDTVPATLFISSDSTPPRVLTAEQVKDMLDEMAVRGHVGMGEQDTYVTFKTIIDVAKQYGITL